MPIPKPDLAQGALCLSDLHLYGADEPAFSTLQAVLSRAAEQQLNIFLLGDLCEVWVGDDDDGPLARAFKQLLSTISVHTFVGLMHGNRDFLFGQELASSTGVCLLPDPYPYGQHILFSHGDRYCTDDAEYQQVRAMLRSNEWQSTVLAQTLEQRRVLAAGLRAQSEQANANKAANIMDVNAAAVAQAMQTSQRRLLIHGHTHRPGREQHADFERIVLGDWGHTAWVAQLRAGLSIGEQSMAALSQGVTLQCLPLQ